MGISMDRMVEFTKQDGSKHSVPVREIERLSWWNDEEEAGLAFNSGDTARIIDRSRVMAQLYRLALPSS